MTGQTIADSPRTCSRVCQDAGPRPARRVRSPRPHAFTLVELLVVLVIMGILLGIAGPAFQRLTVGTGVDAAARMVGAQLTLARTYAITSRRRVAVVMPGLEVERNGSALSNSERERAAPVLGIAFRSCIVDRTKTFVEWVPNTKWEFLPVGTAILEADQDNGTAASSSGADPDDGTMTAVDDVLFPVGEPVGDFDNDGTLEDTGDDLLENVRAVVFKPNGALASVQRAVTVGEGVYAGGWIFRNRDNWRDIYVDQYTGRVTHRQ